MEVNTLSLDGIAFAEESRAGTRAQELPPDITCAEYWSAACVSATAWSALVLYAACRGLG